MVRYPAQERYDAKNRFNVTVPFNRKTEPDLVKKIESVESKASYIKKLIREDLKKKKSKETPPPLPHFRGVPKRHASKRACIKEQYIMGQNPTEIQVFTNSQFGKIRAIDIDGEIGFFGSDLCNILGTDTRDLKSILDSDQFVNVDTIHIGNHGGKKPLIVNESGFYSVVLKSRKPQAKPFQKWVTGEVLPSIRKHGGYLTPQKIEEVLTDPDTIIQLATTLKEEQARRKALEAENQVMQPKALFADAVAASHTSILVGELAKLLKQNGVEIGQNRLFKWLRENGYLMKTGSSYNMPTQRSMEQELFEVKETSITHSDGHITVQKTPKVTGKGQQYFINRFLTKGEVA